MSIARNGLVALLAAASVSLTVGVANAQQVTQQPSVASAPLFPAPAARAVTLSFSDGRAPLTDVAQVNEVLRQVHVRVSLVPTPTWVSARLERIKGNPLSKDESDQIMEDFALSRVDLLEQIRLAGRQPATLDGGILAITATNGGGYPNINDLGSLSKDTVSSVNRLVGPIHVNTADDGTGIDEVMTAIAGGPFNWFFVLPDGVVVKLTSSSIDAGDDAVRVSYPGLTPHAGFMPEHGVAIGYGHGPAAFTIRTTYEGIPHSEMLGSNPWIDFTADVPVVRDQMH